MKNIFVSHSKEDKVIAKKLTGKLESDGMPCYVLSRDKNNGDEKELISQSKIFIVILTQSALKSDELFKQIKLAVDYNCSIIPFKAGKLENSLSLEFMLHSLEWVDAFGDGFDEAYDILLEIIEEISGGIKPAIKEKKQNKVTKIENPVKKYLTIGLISVFAIIILYVILFNSDKKKTIDNKNSTKNKSENAPDFIKNRLSENEKILVGTWSITSYEDSRTLNAQEKEQLIKDVASLKQKVRLIFNSDRSFERTGFTPQPQKGYWEYDHIKHKIFLTPSGIERKEEVNIMDLTEKSMTIIVTENVTLPNGGVEIVTTKISFRKQ